MLLPIGIPVAEVLGKAEAAHHARLALQAAAAFEAANAPMKK